MKMARRYRITYAHVYNGIFKTSASHQNVNAWIADRIRRTTTLRTRMLWIQHMRTIVVTQAIGRNLGQPTTDLLDRCSRLCRVGKLIVLRKLQRRIVQHLWRPGGVLFLRSMESYMQGVGDAQR